MGFSGRRIFDDRPVFSPELGCQVVPAPGMGNGNWSGGCSALYDSSTKRFYLCYKVRTPGTRGGICRIAESVDGRQFETIWETSREAFDSPSIEKSSLFQTQEGVARLYVSYVEGCSNRWQIDLVEATSWTSLDPSERVPILTPEQCGNQGVKDPVVVQVGQDYLLFANYAPCPPDGKQESLERMHAEGNAFVSGIVNTGSGLATSRDGVRFKWHGPVLDPGTSWDAFMARIVAVIRTPPVFTVFYDGRPDVAASYEDKCGIAVSQDLRRIVKLSDDAPVLSSPEGTGCVRYLSAVSIGDEIYYYYEYALGDGSHELRMHKVKKGDGHV